MASLLAAAIASEESLSDASGTPPLIWAASAIGPIERAVSRQAEVFGLELVDSSARAPEDEPAGGFETMPARSLTVVLLRAAYLASSRGVGRVIWPVQIPLEDDAGPDRLDHIGRAIDRALLVGRLATIDAELPEVRIETPLVDLSDEQIGDLIVDVEAPVEFCWFAPAADDPRCAPERRRWGHLLARRQVAIETKSVRPPLPAR